ncbi:MAG: DUF4760 domain-containing protein [Acidobacteriaceae bacterium]
MASSLAAKEDAIVILKLYELRTEAVMRKAREWVLVHFWPNSVEDIRAVLNNFGSDENAFLRQVTSYWEMAAALVNHGTLDCELFLETNAEPFFLLAKFWPFLAEVRGSAPTFLRQVEQLTVKSTIARQRLDTMLANMDKRRQVATANGR